MSKHFMSVLGTGNYSACIYEYEGKRCETRFIQEAILELKNFKEGDRITIFLTDFARNKNYINSGENESVKGLEQILKEKYDGIIEIEDISIPNGKNEDEQWEIFASVYDSIDAGEDIIFDITHGFRSIPMLALSVLNYARTLKNNINIDGIYYGAYEAKDEKGVAPIWNYVSFMDIMDWSTAANSFVQYGNGNQILDVFKEIKGRNIKHNDRSFLNFSKVVEMAERLTNNINTGRGKNLEDKDRSIKKAYTEFNSKYNDTFKEDCENDFKMKPFKAVMDCVQASAEKFFSGKNSEYEIGMATVEWCIKFNLIQQGYTALEETIKTYVCELFGLDTTDYYCREKVASNAINAYRVMSEKETEKEKDKIRADELSKVAEEYRKIFERILEELPKELFKISTAVKQKRNDINHFGFSKDTLNSNKFKDNLSDNYKKLKEFVVAKEK